jgi:hypothetical protein
MATVCEADHMATVCEADHMATCKKFNILPYQYVASLMCLHRMFSNLTRLNLRYSGPIMTESIASYPYKMLQRLVALFSSHPLPLTVKQIQSTASPSFKVAPNKVVLP